MISSKLTLGAVIRGSLLYLLLVSCSSSLITGTIDNRLIPYVKTFREYCELYKVDCSKLDRLNIVVEHTPNFKFIKMILGLPHEGTTIGICYRSSNTVAISTEYMKNSFPADIEDLVLHELAHCVLDKEHVGEADYEIMNPYQLPMWMYLAEYNRLMNTLFGCVKDCPEIKFKRERYPVN